MTRKFLFTLALCALLPAALLLAGSAFASPLMARIVVPARDIARGEVIGDSDLTFATVDGSALAPNIATRIDMLAGMQTRRALRAGETVRADDVRHPVVVTKGQTVTMQFSAPGVELSAMGRAMSEGGVGDIVTVQNPVSYRMISAIVTGAGTVRAADPAAAPLQLTRK